jgi:class 3 adenylate cyclase/tetratricopeptide (TPR) repeat protein
VVTVVFADVAGSTALGERMDPESLQQLLGRYFAEMRAVLERHGGTVEKFIGDAVMAVFGIPVVHEDDALRAVRAAGEMREALRSLELEARIGINTGEVVAGGGETLVAGDAVNVAARLEQAAQPGEVLIGAETYGLVRDAVEVERVDPLALKGKSEPVVALRLVRVDPSAPARRRRLDAPMVGRERERSLLRQAFERAAADRACQLFTVLGAAGVGKSRLAAEFLSELGEEAAVLSGRCLPYGEGITYWPIFEIVGDAASLEQGDGPEAARAKLVALVDEDAELVAARIVEALGLAEGTGGEETFWAIRRLLEALARQRPLVVLFDDVHWAEPTFLDLVEHLADWSRDAPILVLCLARPELLEARAGWGGGKLNATTILLEPLDAEEARRLIDNLSSELPESTRTRVVAAAEGNPLFIEEMVAMLREGGADGVVAIPRTIQALLAARLDGLDRGERTVIERAAVEGKVFHQGAAAALAPDGVDISPLLLSLVRKQLIRPERPTITGERAFRFRHLLIRDAAYEAIPKQARAELHEAFAAWLEQRTTEYDEILGYHLDQAARYRRELGQADEELAHRAAEHLGRAGEAAAARGDVPAAVSLLGRAAGLKPRPPLLLKLGEAQIDAGELELAVKTLAEAVEAAALAGDRRVRADGDLALSLVRLQLNPEGRADELRRSADRAISLHKELGDEPALGRAWMALSDAGNFGGEWSASYRAAERALEHARRGRDRTLELTAATRLAGWAGPMPADEGAELVRALLPDAAGNRVQTALLLRVVAPLEAMRERIDQARTAYRRAQAIYEELGLRFELGRAAFGIFTAEFVAGDVQIAEREARRGYEIFAAMGDRAYFSTLAAMVGEALYAQGQVDEAEQYALVCREAASSDDIYAQMQWRALLAKVLARRAEFEEAERLARDASDRGAEAKAFPQGEGDALVSLAEVIRLAGRPAEAARAAMQAAVAYERKANIVSAEKARKLGNKLSGAPA